MINKNGFKMKTLLTISMLIAVSFLGAQEKYRIQYDYKTDNFEYYKLNKSYEVIDTLAHPRFKRNSLIEIKMLNINPFAVNIKTDIQEEEIHATSSGGYNFGNLLGGITSMTNSDLKLNVTKLPENLDTPSYVNKDIFGETSSRSSLVENKFSHLNTISSNVDALKRTFLANLTNPNLDKETILNNIKKVAALQTDSRLADPNDNFHVYLASLKKIIKEDANFIVFNVNEMKGELSKKSDNQKESISLGELRAQNSTYSYLESILSQLDESSNWTAENLNKIEALYTSLESASFEQTYDYEIAADKVNLELKFEQSEFANELDDDDAVTTLKTRHVKIFSKGGFKINTSVALTLNNFQSKSFDYFIDENGIIGAEKNNYFIPNLSTLINFYPVISENFNLGGSFGLSIPIAEGINGVNYLFGPSLILGNKSRLALSAGVAFGPVKKLTNGLQVGDYTNLNDVDSFTKNVYDFGYYFGISFNIFNLK